MNATTLPQSVALSNAIFSSTEERVIALLGQSLPLETVASAAGLTVSRVSQISTDPKCAEKIAKLRYDSLQKHNIRDSGYDEIEDRLIERLRDNIPMMVRPMEILKGIQVINAAKRRGSQADVVAPQQTSPVVQLTIPQQVIQSFTTNIHNQVISAGAQELITIPSGNMQKLLNSRSGEQNEQSSAIATSTPKTLPYEPTRKETDSST